MRTKKIVAYVYSDDIGFSDFSFLLIGKFFSLGR